MGDKVNAARAYGHLESFASWRWAVRLYGLILVSVGIWLSEPKQNVVTGDMVNYETNLDDNEY
jgi:hypothetical protein